MTEMISLCIYSASLCFSVRDSLQSCRTSGWQHCGRLQTHVTPRSGQNQSSALQLAPSDRDRASMSYHNLSFKIPHATVLPCGSNHTWQAAGNDAFKWTASNTAPARQPTCNDAPPVENHRDQSSLWMIVSCVALNAVGSDN